MGLLLSILTQSCLECTTVSTLLSWPPANSSSIPANIHKCKSSHLLPGSCYIQASLTSQPHFSTLFTLLPAIPNVLGISSPCYIETTSHVYIFIPTSSCWLGVFLLPQFLLILSRNLLFTLKRPLDSIPPPLTHTHSLGAFHCVCLIPWDYSSIVPTEAAYLSLAEQHLDHFCLHYLPQCHVQSQPSAPNSDAVSLSLMRPF